MRTQIHDSGVTIWLSANDTYQWATKPGANWPCSFLRGKRLVASFDRGGLCDYSVNGRYDSSGDLGADELSAICADHLADKLPREHPAYFVAVGQFLSHH